MNFPDLTEEQRAKQSISIKKATPGQTLKFYQDRGLMFKIIWAQERIREWHEAWDGDIAVSYSGGKDSEVLLHITRQIFPEVPAVFVDTGMEFPEIRAQVRTHDNVEWLNPKMKFKEVCEKYGFPLISKDQACAISRYRNTKSELQKYRRLNGWPGGKKGMISKKWQNFAINSDIKVSDNCCQVMKKDPIKKYQKETGRATMAGTLAAESNSRKMRYFKNGGCNAYGLKAPLSSPLSIWTEEDIWAYIRKYDLKIAKIYAEGYTRTGCMFCAFGAHLETGENRFQKLSKTHPKVHTYLKRMGMEEALNSIGVEFYPTNKGEGSMSETLLEKKGRKEITAALEAMSINELVAEHNRIVAAYFTEGEAKINPVTRFATRAVGKEKITNILPLIGADFSDSGEKPSIGASTKPASNKFRPSVEGMRIKYQMLTKNPETTRKEFITVCVATGKIKASTASAQWPFTMEQLEKRFGPDGKDYIPASK